jgi:hypothetical protein
MGRYNFLALISAFIISCGGIEPPVRFWISSTCEPYHPKQVETIQSGIETWNQAACANIVSYQGIIYSTMFSIDSLYDDALTVYCIENENEPGAASLESGPYMGISIGDFGGDILINMEAIKGKARMDYATESSSAPRSYDYYYLKVLKNVAAHEMGHKLQRSDLYSAPSTRSIRSIMQSYWDEWLLGPTKFDIYGSKDAYGLCDMVDCPPAEQCPTAPLF